KKGRSADASGKLRRSPRPAGGAESAVVLVRGRARGFVWTFLMYSDDARKVPGPIALTPVVEFRSVSKWYGNVIGVNNLTFRIPSGVTGLLGPNGAGKSTLLQLATGQLHPSQGEVRVLGHRVWNNAPLTRFIGLCPEQDAFYEWMTGWDFIYTCARLSGMPRGDARSAAGQALELVGMTPNMQRAIRGYSKGKRQRTKL